MFVCTANICRSPLAEGLLRHRLREMGLHRRIVSSSVGTRASMSGHKPDARAKKVASEAGVSLAGIRASQLRERNLAVSDIILAMDKKNLRELEKMCPPEHLHKVCLLMSYLPDSGAEEVPDPYYGNYQGFKDVFQLIDRAMVPLLTQICAELD